MGFGLGFGFNKSSSSQASESGLTPFQRTAAFEKAVPVADESVLRYRSLLESPLPSLNILPSGFLPQQMAGVSQLFNDAIGRFSASGAARGQLSPENTSAVVGSALQNISPALLSLIQDNVLKSIFMPEQIRQSRLAGFAGTVNPYLTLATSGSSGIGSSSAFGMSVKGGDESGGGGGRGGGAQG